MIHINFLFLKNTKDYNMNSMFNARKKKKAGQRRNENSANHVASSSYQSGLASSQSSIQVNWDVSKSPNRIKYWHMMFLERNTKSPLSFEIPISL